ncbi:MAG: hypothetical protein ACREV8_16550, partial [Gammaproteobacteria bacterium]
MLADLENAQTSAPAPADSGLAELVGLGPTAGTSLGQARLPTRVDRYDETVTSERILAMGDLYYIYQHERMKIFQVLQVLRRLFQQGRMRIQRGPGARALYTLEKWTPLRYTIRDRMIAYRRAFNYGTAPGPAGAIVNSNFHRQFVGFMVSLSQYFRDLLIGEVIRGGPLIEQRPFGSIGTVQRLGLDLRYALDRSTYGNILALTMETGHFLKTVLQLLDAPDIKKSFDANTKWDVIEVVSNRYLGGIAEPSQRAKMAESGRRILQFVADNDFKTAVDPILFQSEVRPMGPHAEAWVAAYRMTPEGRAFSGVTPALRNVLGIRDAARV